MSNCISTAPERYTERHGTPEQFCNGRYVFGTSKDFLLILLATQCHEMLDTATEYLCSFIDALFAQQPLKPTWNHPILRRPVLWHE
jgi:hypothetical protein